MQIMRSFVGTTIVLSSLALLPGRAAAQEAPLTSSLTPSAVDSFLVLVPVRSPFFVNQELGAAKDLLQRVQLERAQADEFERMTDARIKTAEAEIKAFKARADEAKRAKEEAARITADGDKKAAEGRKQLLERRRDLRKSEREAADARAKLASAQIKALELEATLQTRREERLSAPSSDVAGAQADNALAALERQVLEAQKQAADANIDVTKRDKQLVERRLELLKAQSSLLSPR